MIENEDGKLHNMIENEDGKLHTPNTRVGIVAIINQKCQTKEFSLADIRR